MTVPSPQPREERTTCQSIGGGAAGRCGEPAAYVERGKGWCLRHGPDLIRRFGANDFEPLTPAAEEFLAAFAVNGYGPVGHWPDAPEGDDDAEKPPSPQQNEARRRPPCIGFGKAEGYCTNVATANADILNPPLWCADCEAARIAHTDARFAAMTQRFGGGSS